MFSKPVIACVALQLASTGSAAALPDVQSHSVQSKCNGPLIPTYLGYGSAPKFMADIKVGTPANGFLPTVMDTGSLPYWVSTANAIINDGNPSIGAVGKCNYTVKHGYNYKKSKTASGFTDKNTTYAYSYGGNHHFVNVYTFVNDTLNFGHSVGNISDVQMGLSNFTVYNTADSNCSQSVRDFDVSIMGLGPFGKGIPFLQNPPSFRTNLRKQGKISRQILSMWSNKPPKSIKQRLTGAALFGQVLPKTAYTGKKVYVPYDPPKDNSYIGYYVATPGVAVTSGSKTQQLAVTSKSTTNCLVDSGSHSDSLPVSQADLFKVPGLFLHKNGPFTYPAYRSSCDSMPLNVTLDFTFSQNKTNQVTVKVPLKNYARSIPGSHNNTICGFTIDLDIPDCVLSAQFFTGAALEFDDDHQRMGVAQGAVSTDAAHCA